MTSGGASRRRKRVLFPASTPLSYAVMRPLTAALATRPDVEVWITSRHGGLRLAERCLAHPLRYSHPLIARFRSFDVTICSGFSYHSRRGGMLVQMFHGVSPKNYAVQPQIDRYDRVFLVGEYHRRKFVRAGWLTEDDPRALRIGMPKTDPLLAAVTDREAQLAELGLDPSRPVVLYAPTRSGSAGSSLDVMGAEVIDRIAGMPVNLLVKLHDRSRRRFRRQLRVDYERLVREREVRHPGSVRLWPDHDVVPAMRLADVLISDLSSVAGEFLLRDRPIVFLGVPGHEAKIRSSAQRAFGADDPDHLDAMRESGELIGAPAEVAAAIERALADPGARSALRRARAAQLFYHPGQATRRALEAIGDLLGSPPH